MTKQTMLDKMREVQPQSQAIGEFLEWLWEEKGVILCTAHAHTDECYAEDDHRHAWPICGWEGYIYHPFYMHTEGLLAEYFGINLSGADKEKRDILADLQKNTKGEI